MSQASCRKWPVSGGYCAAKTDSAMWPIARRKTCRSSRRRRDAARRKCPGWRRYRPDPDGDCRRSRDKRAPSRRCARWNVIGRGHVRIRAPRLGRDWCLERHAKGKNQYFITIFHFFVKNFAIFKGKVPYLPMLQGSESSKWASPPYLETTRRQNYPDRYNGPFQVTRLLSPASWMDWLIAWQIGWLIHVSSVHLIDRLIEWIVPIVTVFDRLIGWLIDWLGRFVIFGVKLCRDNDKGISKSQFSIKLDHRTSSEIIVNFWKRDLLRKKGMCQRFSRPIKGVTVTVLL